MALGAYQGSLFTNDFMESTIADLEDWRRLSDDDVAAIKTEVETVFARFPTDQSPNEATMSGFSANETISA